MIDIIPTSIIFILFLQIHIRNHINNTQLIYHTISSYTNIDIYSKFILIFGVLSSSLQIYMINGNTWIFYNSFLIYGVLLNTDKIYIQELIHYFSVLVFLFINVYLSIYKSDYINCLFLIFLFVKIIFVCTIDSKKMLCFNLEWIFMTWSTYYITN